MVRNRSPAHRRFALLRWRLRAAIGSSLPETARVARLQWVLVWLVALGAVLSVFGALREAGQIRALERLRFEQAVDTHLAELQEGLRARALLMDAVAAMFNPGEPIRPGALGPYGRSFLALSPEVTAIAWLPAVPAERVPDALAAIAAAGIEAPLIFGQNRRPLDVPKLGYVPHVILDIEPTDSAPVLLGGTATDWPERRTAIETARASRRATTPGPTKLFQPPHPFAFLIYAPVFSEAGAYLGSLSFSYRVERLFVLSSQRGHGSHPFSVHVYDTSTPQTERLISLEANGEAGIGPDLQSLAGRQGDSYRTLEFAGLPLTLAYLSTRDLAGSALRRGILFAALGLGLTALVVLSVALVIRNARRLAAEVAARRSAEERLNVLIQELNHRVRNVLTVAQSILMRSLRADMSVAEAKEIVIGRYQALANVMSLLTQSEWKGADLTEILSAEMLPYEGRYTAEGPALILRPRSAQTISLVLHELVTNSAKYGALSTASGHVEIAWSVDGEAREFRLSWRESGGPAVTPPVRKGFGAQILERVAPKDLAGSCELAYDPSGLRYELRAPAGEVGETVEPERRVAA